MKRLLEVADASNTDIEIFISDDGSSPPHRDAIANYPDSRVCPVLNERNLGRSGAVNSGVNASKSDLVLILDCDCPPEADTFFQSHLESISDADISIGGLLKLKDDFWGKYQDLAVKRRERLFQDGMAFSFTTQNVLLKRILFSAVGGYDESFKQYGFEDRDLLIRLQQSGARFAYSPSAAVVHSDDGISLKSVTRKMQTAGQHTAELFRERHPDAYRSLGYALIDGNLNPILKILGSRGGDFAEHLASRLDPHLESIPFPAGVALTKFITALAYASGTTRSQSTRKHWKRPG